ncbi:MULTISPECIES: glucosaminidase domain-containing protein [Amniculibacterium]|jgi:LysM repeat protein|uniref:glucosaminidase domain-containing protein n=1 Tax=Amniculibacterium TaxID=2715289 RepID=UPI000F59BFD6|nr:MULTISPECIES: glucosaminidase domain-containing protein [Amniculibacterium]
MKKLLAITSFFILSKNQAQTWKTEEQYIQKFATYAVEEMEKYHIPASITLAQGLLETGGGQSRLAQEGNNHFGIKCKETWTGKSMKHTDDAPNECFRVYDNPRESYEDHSKFLVERKHYAPLFQLDPKDYRAWAFGLKKAGYATNPKYAYILLNKIEKYKLYEFDNTTSKEVLYTVLRLYPGLKDDSSFMAQLDNKKEKTSRNIPSSLAAVNEKPQFVEIKSKVEALNDMLIKNHPNGGLKYVIVPENTTIRFIASKYGIPEGKIMKWNETTLQEVAKNSIVFLEPKNTEARIATYTVENGENMHTIAQKFGIRLDKLYSKNRMSIGEEPKSGDVLYLQDRRPRS